MFGLEGVLAGIGLEHVGLVLTLAGLAYHSRKVTKAGSALAGVLSTVALFAVFLAVLVGLDVFDPNMSRAWELGRLVVDGVRWVVTRAL